MSIFKGIATLTLLIFYTFSVTGCTTAMWDRPSLIQDHKDTFKFTIHLGGFSGEETAFAKLQYEIVQFQIDKGYKNHRIIGKNRNLFPGNQFEYTVQFFKE